MQVDAVHVEPLDFLQVAHFRLGWHLTYKLLVEFGYLVLEGDRLSGDEPELGNVARGVTPWVVVSKLRLNSVGAKLCGQVLGYRQPALQDVLFHLQEELVPSDFLHQLARVSCVELYTKVQCNPVVAGVVS